jgi:hypothetical protein
LGGEAHRELDRSAQVEVDQQFHDHHQRQREREIVDQFGLARGQEIRDELVGDVLDTWPQRLDPTSGSPYRV